MNTKLQSPALPDNIINRSRLIDSLHSKLNLRSQIVWSPAGYGKTTLISQFANDLEIPVCWYTIDESDRAVSTLINGIVSSIRDKFPLFGKDSEFKLRAIDGINSEIKSVAKSLAHDISNTISEYFILVLEDFHTISQSHSSKQLIDILLDNVPDNCHVLISSRDPVNLPAITKLFSANQITFLDSSLLSFTIEETQDLIKSLFDIDIEQSEAKKLTDSNCGWVTGILLQALNSIDKGNFTYNTWGNTVVKQDTFAYLSNELLSKQPTDIKNFLLETSLLNELDPNICDSYRNTNISRVLLSQIEQHNLFIHNYTGKHKTYQYNPLFRDFLRDKLLQENPKKYSDCHKKLAKLYSSKQQWEEAIYHFIAARIYKQAIKIIKNNGEQLIDAGKWMSLEKWIKQLPEEVIHSEPDILLLYSQSQIHLGNVDKAYKYTSQVLKECKAAKHQFIRAKALSIRSAIFRLNGHFEEAERDIHTAIRILDDYPDQFRILGDIYRRLGNILLEQGQLKNATKQLNKSLKNYTSDLDLLGMADTNNSLGIIYKRLSDFCRAKVHFENARGIWQKLGNGSALAQVMNNIGTIHQRQGQYNLAIQTLEKGRQQAKLFGYQRIEACILINLAEVHGDIGNCVKALELFEEGTELAERVMEPYYIAWAKAGMAEIHRQMGDYDKAETLVNESICRASENSQHYEMNLFSIIKAKIKHNQGYNKESSDILSNIIPKIKTIGDKEALSKIYFNLAQIAFISQNYNRATYWLKKTAAIANQLDHDTFLVVEGRNSIPLLEYGFSKRIGDELFGKIQKKVQTISWGNSDKTTKTSNESDNTSTMYDLKVHALGEVNVEIGNRIGHIEWRSNRAKELFFLLLVSPDGKTKEQITNALWPDLSPGKVSGNFHVNLFRARRAIFPGIFVLENNIYKINPNLRIWFDVKLFQDNLRKLRTERIGPNVVQLLQQNMELYKGNFLEGFYSEWVEEYRHEIENGYMKTLSYLAKNYTNKGQFDQAIAVLEKYSTVDPYNDDVYFNLMELYINQGENNFAKKLYRKYTDVLKTDLQMEIPQRIKDLFNSIDIHN